MSIFSNLMEILKVEKKKEKDVDPNTPDDIFICAIVVSLEPQTKCINTRLFGPEGSNRVAYTVPPTALIATLMADEKLLSSIGELEAAQLTEDEQRELIFVHGVKRLIEHPVSKRLEQMINSRKVVS